MATTHYGAATAITMEQAATAMKLLAVMYRLYMDNLYEAYPEVCPCSCRSSSAGGQLGKACQYDFWKADEGSMSSWGAGGDAGCGGRRYKSTGLIADMSKVGTAGAKHTQLEDEQRLFADELFLACCRSKVLVCQDVRPGPCGSDSSVGRYDLAGHA